MPVDGRRFSRNAMPDAKLSLPAAFLARLRFPWLFVVLAGLLLFDLLVPDPIPLIDELVLTVLTLLAASWRRDEPSFDKPPEKNVTPPR